MIEISKNPDVLKIIEQGLEQGIAAICSNVRSEAVTLAPVDTHLLENSIVWKTSKSGIGSIPGVQNPKRLEGYVGSAVEYAVYQEFGTRKMRPQPYLRPAIAIHALGRKGADILIKIQNQAARDEITLTAMKDRETFGLR